MGVFTDDELAYLSERRLGRIASVGKDGTPHVTPVGWRIDQEAGVVEVGGYDLTNTKKFRDVERSGRASIVIDDLASTDPWRPRGIEIRGRAEALRAGQGVDRDVIRIHPERIVRWGLGESGLRSARSVDAVEHANSRE
jgi:pyridoxamine 5'-phosphate oxidase family protein